MPRKKKSHSLTQQQVNRIRQIRDQRLDHWQQQQRRNLKILGVGDLAAERPGVVIANYGSHVEVEGEEGDRSRCAVRETVAENPVCGDRVLWSPAPGAQGVITHLLPRSSVVRRPGPYRRLQTMAANVEVMVVTTTALLPNPGLLDRYLVAASAAGLGVVLVVNKIDLATDADPWREPLAIYPRVGYPLLPLSAATGEGLEALAEHLRGRTAMFVGQSGVGKSSLIAHWRPDAGIRVAAVNAETGRGRHTTSATRLYHLSCGGRLIDSPGVRAFDLHDVTPEEVAGHFLEVAPLLGRCRFSDCRHREEPGCAVLAGLAQGLISPARLASLHRIVDSLAGRQPF
ncbi:MAG: ribosome small subunit-dependent GTPase A [Magnetococcales bacterium]|nr:ribosome small subunit-dependent GTPase A [Magnetococcales bacterium]